MGGSHADTSDGHPGGGVDGPDSPSGPDSSTGGVPDGPTVGGPDGPTNGGPGDGVGPHLVRQGDNFQSEHNYKGQRKSHLNADGDLIPANPDGNASIVDHIVGRDPAKSDSPYTSLSREGSDAKDFGSGKIRIDLPKLEADIAAGRVKDVEVFSPEQVQGAIQDSANKVAGRPVDLEVPKGTSKAEAEELARSMGFSNTKARKIAQRMIDMMNTRRDAEWLIKGVVPSEYITGPFNG